MPDLDHEHSANLGKSSHFSISCSISLSLLLFARHVRDLLQPEARRGYLQQPLYTGQSAFTFLSLQHQDQTQGEELSAGPEDRGQGTLS